MRILVTGGCGFVGQHTVSELQNAGNEVHIIDLAPSLGDMHYCDVTSDAVSDVVKSISPQAIVHLAAHVNARASVQRAAEDYAVNVTGTIRLLEAARENDVECFVFASSAGVYGDPKSVPIKETDPCRPISPYGASKLSAENFVRQYGLTYGIRCIVLRYANIFGPGQEVGSEAAVIPAFIKAVQQGEPIRIFGDGEQTRDFVFVKDVARVNAKVITKHLAGTFNVGSGMGVSINSLAQSIIETTQSSSPIEHLDSKEGDIRHSVFDVTKLQGIIGDISEGSFSSRLKETCAWYAAREQEKSSQNQSSRSGQ